LGSRYRGRFLDANQVVITSGIDDNATSACDARVLESRALIDGEVDRNRLVFQWSREY
jgi:hypothetical protein